MSSFSKFAWGVLAYNLLAVAWGVYVRASKSGDGCGNHWPDCDGGSTPLHGDIARIVEASHRLSTGLVGVLVIALVIWARRNFPAGHLVRKFALAAFGLTLLEGLVGAALVKFQLVTDNATAQRAVVMCFHVISTFLLMGALCVTALSASGASQIRLKGQGPVGWPIAIAALGMCLLAVSGAISALGHTLKPVNDVLGSALDPRTFWMVRLQPLHPLISVVVGLYITLSAGLITHLRPDPRVKLAAQVVVGLYGFQLAVGLFNIWTKAPIAVQMFHLAVADANWITLVCLAVYAFQERIEHVEHRPAPREVGVALKLQGRDLVNSYIALTKPRVISLLLFTALAATIGAKGSWPGFSVFMAVAVGGYMVAGAANAINMVIDRDIDFNMKRTATRPTVTQSISSPAALRFAFTLAAGAFAILWIGGTLLSAVMALCGLVFYVIVYTMLLKRRTWQNIVIGGAAGAFPPLVGWAAVTNDLPPLALYLFAIIFVWTPVHFWALAIMLKDDYAAAGIPMLPVIKGEKTTVRHIIGYTVLTIVATALPLTVPHVGWMYIIATVVLNVILVERCYRLAQKIDRFRASSLFHYSMLYLAILFAVFAADRVLVNHQASLAPANAEAASVRLTSLLGFDRQNRQVFVKDARIASGNFLRGELSVNSNSLAFSELR